MENKRFLVIQTAFLGDVVLATPVFTELKRIYPKSQIDVLVRKGNEALLENHPAVNQVFVFDKSKGKTTSLFKIIKTIRQNKYDELINLQRFLSAGIISLFTHAKQKVGFNKNAISWIYTKKVPHELSSGWHEVERNLATIAHHKAKKQARPTLYPSKKDYDKVKEFQTKDYYCLAPASVWFTKQLPLEKWIELANLLSKKGTVYLIGGKTDISICELIQKACKRSVVILAGQLSLLESAALMQSAKMNFVNDSGPQHLASAVNAPVRAFFCSTIPDFGFGPLSDNAYIIETKKALNCRPCGLHGHQSCPKGHFDCGTTITIDESALRL